MTKPTYIHEFPHPGVVVHYHPVGGEQLTLPHIDFALTHKVHAVELDLHYREADGEIVANHDDATAESPTLEQVIQLVLQHQQGNATVNHDNLQFFLVLEPKEYEQRLFAGIVKVLEEYTPYLSTAVTPGDPQRGITVLITGDYPREFYASFAPVQVNRLFVAEFVDYGAEIVNLSEQKIPFQWVSIQWRTMRKDAKGRVKLLHTGADALFQGKYNVRIWDCPWAELAMCLASAADAINIDRAEVEAFQQMISRTTSG